MSKRRKKIEHTASETPPELSGAALLISEIPEAKLDLHGSSAREAEIQVYNFLQRHARTSRGKVIHIITGKGTNSDGPPVLPGLVARLLSEEFPEDVLEHAGLVGGGAIAVRMGG